MQIVWKGPVFSPTGYGMASRGYALGLHRQGVDVKVDWARKGPVKSDRRLLQLVRKPYAANKRKVAIFHNTPNRVHVGKAREQFERIILNTVWETSRIPRRWFPNINKFDAVVVPSTHNKAALMRSGVTVPIYIVPHGVNTREFSPVNKKFPLEHARGAFIFVSVFGFQHRKNPEALLRAYWEEFSSADRTLLVIKTYGLPHGVNDNIIRNKIVTYKKRLGLAAKKTAPIRLIPGVVTSKRLKGIYASGHAFVLPTRGEGVGLPFLESLASGVPVITTGWGGHMDFLNKRNAFLVSYRLMEPAIHMRSKHAISRKFSSLFANQGQKWAEPNLASLKKWMRYAYEHRELCKRKGEQGRRDVQKLSWNRSGLALKKVIESVLQLPKQAGGG